MKQAQFESQYSALWEEVNAVLDGKADGQPALPALYRRLCQCLALAGPRGYSPALTSYLQDLVARCHRRLYGTATERPAVLLGWLTHDLPRRVRAEWRLLAFMLCALFGTALVSGLLVWHDPHRAYLFSSAEHLAEMHRMYLPSNMHLGRGGSEGDLRMFGFYIWNNVSICFRTFAGGVFGGMFSVLSVGLNGLQMGVIASWLSLDPETRRPFWSFVITHASFELTGLLLSGVAGLRLGLALICPGRMSRRHALYEASGAMYPVVVGAALLTVLAAFFEAFWSAQTVIPDPVKYTVGALCWGTVILYFALAGRDPR
jgi:uncharacterized membrane protein SpoIIM required for sporulation